MGLTNEPNVITSTTRPAAYDQLRDGFSHLSGVTAIVLLSSDGIARCGYGLPVEEVQTLAAACSGLASLGRGVAGTDGGDLVHVNVTLERRQVIITGCGEGSVLVVCLTREAPLGVAMAETLRLAKAFGRQMGTAERADLAAR
ncbi:roadblock/LC7 domain-containing protein [Streptomyces sp. NPDC049881]|uniref:roadblock/LC7 domain-containing protein n=1 Tax=unclassified Streptomyces TaxID=2593676 RepID=UPI003442C2B4